ncbi:MAG: hypothetical protein ACI88A_001852 [Paraglaciecola sp.]|jgi:hypothetical protein
MDLLLEKLMKFEVGSQTDKFTFCEGFSRKNDWSIDYAKRCFEEYKKFIYLIKI